LMRYVVVFLLSLATYLVFVGSVTLYDIVTGIAVSSVAATVFGRILVRNPRKLEVRRFVELVRYLATFIATEIRAHLELAKIVLSPNVSKSIRPGIVRVRYDLESDYGVTLLANSITNTPGTLVVDLDEEERALYVHWINVRTLEPEEIRDIVSRSFEEHARKIFD